MILNLPEFVESEVLKILIERVMGEFPEADQGCKDICRVSTEILMLNFHCVTLMLFYRLNG